MCSSFVDVSEDTIRTRDHKCKLVQNQCYCDVRKYNFTNTVISIWNSLAKHVISAETVNTFKKSSDQDVLYDYSTDLYGTRNRKGNIKVIPYALLSVGPRADPGVLAVSPQVTF